MWLKKGLKPRRRRELLQWMSERYCIPLRRACRLARFSRAAWYRRSQAKDQSALRARIRELAASRPCFGYLRILVMLRRVGWAINHKRVHRLSKASGIRDPESCDFPVVNCLRTE